MRADFFNGSCQFLARAEGKTEFAEVISCERQEHFEIDVVIDECLFVLSEF
jgi:hypothetical protein